MTDSNAAVLSTPPSRLQPSPRALLVPLALWFFAALALSTSGLFTFERRFLVPVMLAGTTLSLVLARVFSPNFAAHLRALSSRWLVGLHVVRLPIGLAFLALGARGELHPLFATRAGWGDVVAGGLAVVALALVVRGEARHRGALLVWNALGLADIIMVVATAQRILLGTDAPEKMMRLAGFPGALLPTFLVPLVLFTHGSLFARWRP
ncbi:MAG: hypothetical protein U0271_18745 [Polyangiaceae bacterium]